jgi:hypothetical protein
MPHNFARRPHCLSRTKKGKRAHLPWIHSFQGHPFSVATLGNALRHGWSEKTQCFLNLPWSQWASDSVSQMSTPCWSWQTLRLLAAIVYDRACQPIPLQPLVR